MEVMDCLMTTMCTDRPLPKAVDDYNRSLNSDDDTQPTLSSYQHDYGNNLFQRLYDFDVQSTIILYKANDAEYSKLAMGPLWYEVQENILPFVQDSDDSNNDKSGKRVKLAVVSGHDTTIAPFLIALGSNLWGYKDWPPYASMVVLEIHRVNIDGKTDRKIFRSNFAFRLVYNGQVLTSLVDGCTEGLELCDWNILSDRITDFAILDRDCESRNSGGEISSTTRRAEDFLSTTGWIAVCLVVVIFSMVLGGVSVWVYLTGDIPFLSNGLPTSELDAHTEDQLSLKTDRYGDYKRGLPRKGTFD
jgi:ubiquitin-like domain-containing CTD phosphatase 1